MVTTLDCLLDQAGLAGRRQVATPTPLALLEPPVAAVTAVTAVKELTAVVRAVLGYKPETPVRAETATTMAVVLAVVRTTLVVKVAQAVRRL